MADQSMPSGPGTFCWFEHFTPDTAKSKEYYTKLFGWTTQEMPLPSGPYTIWMKGESGLGGMMAMPTSEGAPSWLCFIQVEDIESSHRRAVDLGGTSCVPPTPIPGIGHYAVLKDAVGASFALYQSAR